MRIWTPPVHARNAVLPKVAAQRIDVRAIRLVAAPVWLHIAHREQRHPMAVAVCLSTRLAGPTVV